MPFFLTFKAHKYATDRTFQLGGLHVLGVHLAFTPVLWTVSEKYVVVLIFLFLETFQFV